MGLGRLYEAGLGVPKDLPKAMNLYRRASGLKDDDIGLRRFLMKLESKVLIS
jgi:TPR repeat protein